MANSLREELEALIAIYDGESSQNEYFGFVIAERLQAILHSHPAADGAVVPEVAAFNWIADNGCDIRQIDMPTGQGDSGVIWSVVEFHMQAPTERAIGYGQTPLAAVLDAMKDSDDPTRWALVPEQADAILAKAGA